MADTVTLRLVRYAGELIQPAQLPIPSARPMPDINANLKKWNVDWDWTKLGEEWTPDEAWRAAIVANGMEPHLKADMSVLEIGPGGGRWTEKLLEYKPSSLIGVDLSPVCIELCTKRFEAHPEASFRANDGKDLSFVESDSIDFVWSFDVFVHMEADVIGEYFAQFARIMRKGAVGVVHYPSIDRAVLEDKMHGWRGQFSSPQMRELVAKHSFTLVHDHFDEHISSGNSSIVVFTN